MREARLEEVGRQLQLIADELGGRARGQAGGGGLPLPPGRGRGGCRAGAGRHRGRPRPHRRGRVHHSERVVELLVIDTDKGRPSTGSATRSGGAAVLYLGDSPTDEHALRDPGRARRRGEGGQRRDRWPSSGWPIPDAWPSSIAHLADLHATGWPAPRASPDRPPLLPVGPAHRRHCHARRPHHLAVPAPHRLVGHLRRARRRAGGRLLRRLRPGQGAATGQRYVGRHAGAGDLLAHITVTDYLDCSGGRPERLAGRSDLIRVIEGRARPASSSPPARLRSPLHPPRSAATASRSWGPRTSPCSGHRAWSGRSSRTGSTTGRGGRRRAGRPAVRPRVPLWHRQHAAGHLEEDERRSRTRRFWASGPSASTRPRSSPSSCGAARSPSKALCHGPTGAIVAAATTASPSTRRGPQLGLPLLLAARRRHGGHRPRSPGELRRGHGVPRLGAAHPRAARDDPERLRPLYLVTGRHLAPEADIAELPATPAAAGAGGQRRRSPGAARRLRARSSTWSGCSHRGRPAVQPPLAARGGHGQGRRAPLAEPDHGIWEIRLPLATTCTPRSCAG